ncbi:MAG: Hsp70 family protein, partial [Thermodesulfobacteriota bacterium]
GLIAGEPLGHILLDVTAHSLGVKTMDTVDWETNDADFFSVIIRRNTRLPVRKSEVYYTMQDDQPGVEVEIFQGESPSCKENALIGRFYFPLKPSPSNSPVLTEFAYDKEGLVHITVDQKGFHNRKEVTLDVRRKKILNDVEEEAADQEVMNYILEKAKKLRDHPELSEAFRGELKDLAFRYEQALKQEGDLKEIDDLEDRLLDKMEKAEERLSPDE